MEKVFRLSKSKILSGLQCEKRLWLEVHQPELRDESAATQFSFALGHNVGEIAQQLVPNGHLIEWDEGLSHALSETKRMINEKPETPLFEATFRHDGVLIRSDILFKEKDGFRMVEVKASASEKPYHVQDCAVQYWVTQMAGYPVKRIELAHVDNTFVYKGDGNYKGLLKHIDITAKVLSLQEEVPKWVNRLKTVLSGSVPEIEVGDHCGKPYECPFCSHCWPEGPDYPIGILPYIRQPFVAKLQAEGFEDVREIPDGRLYSENHERVRRVTISGRPEIDPELGNILRNLPYPRYYLDFETLGAAVPIWKGTRPYHPFLPFQWSCHIENKPGDLQHSGYLDLDEKEPIRPLAEMLIKTLGKTGPILAYSHFENSVISNLASIFPDLAADLSELQQRIVDLFPLMRAYYYHPEMHGSWSIKNVLPTIAPDLDYGSLEDVQDGMGAQSAYLEAIDVNTDEERRNKLESSLWEYCKLDTLAMVRIVQFFT